MSKRHRFEEILETEFRWPHTGDLPFKPAAAELGNAVVSEDVAIRFVAMIEGYKLGADCMVERAGDNSIDRDQLVYPVIFNYRQFIELSLKRQLMVFGDGVGIEPNWKTHDLVPLWSAFADMLDRYGTTDPDYADGIVAQVVAEFSKIDPNSFSYRYPVDTKGNALPVTLDALDLAQLMDVMNGVAGFFTGCDAYLSDLRGRG